MRSIDLNQFINRKNTSLLRHQVFSSYVKRWIRTIRHIYLLVSCLWLQSALSAPIPDLLCQELHVIQIDPHSMRVQEFESRTLYRFKAGILYLSSPDQDEYLYNKVVEVEPMRYTAGHKTFQFETANFRNAILVHTFKDEVRVSHTNCTRT